MSIKKFTFIIIPCLFLLCFQRAEAAELTANPAIIDESVKAKDIMEYDIKVKNNSNKSLTVYTVVSDFSQEKGAIFPEPGEKFDRKDHASQWIVIKRGQEVIDSGKEATIPLEIRVSMYAVPGKYYALVSFVSANDGYDAVARVREGQGAQLFVKLSLEEKIIEKAELIRFKTSKNFNLKSPVNFNLRIGNIGNTDIKPEGSIFIYDRRGVEVKEININEGGVSTASNGFFEISKDWECGKSFGKFRARLIGEYGSNQKRDLQDVIYFWVLPWKFLLIGFILFLVFIILISFVLFGRPLKSKKNKINNKLKIEDNKKI